MLRKKDVASVFGNAQRISYVYMRRMNKLYEGSFKTLVIDDKDGLTFHPFYSSWLSSCYV